MPTPLTPLPAALGPIFTRRAALTHGVAAGRLRASDLARTTRGVRQRRSDDCGEELLDRARQLAAVLGETCVFSHLTAARLWGLPTLRAWSSGEDLHVLRPMAAPPFERAGVRARRGLERATRRLPNGLRVTSVPETIADLAATTQLDDLVAMLDHGLSTGLISEAQLVGLPAGRKGRRGVRRLRRACELARLGSASPWESKARVCLVEAGLPEPELNGDVYDAVGQWLARCDFVWRAARVVGEYDGDHHRTDRRQWQHDRARRALLEDAGWTYIELTASSLTRLDEQLAVVARLRRLLMPHTHPAD